MIGILIQAEDRPEIVFEDGTLYGGLHCGDCFQLYAGTWFPVRLEYDEDWFLLANGQSVAVPYGSRVKV